MPIDDDDSEPFLSPQTVNAIADLFDKAGTKAQRRRRHHPKEDNKTSSLVDAILDFADESGLRVTARGLGIGEEEETGGDMEIVIVGRDADGQPDTKGVILQSKRDDEGRLPGGVNELKKSRGPKGQRRSQLAALKDDPEAAAVLIFGQNEQVEVVPVRELPADPGTRDIRQAAIPLPDLMRQAAQCRFGRRGYVPPEDVVSDLYRWRGARRPRWTLKIYTPEFLQRWRRRDAH